MTEGIPSRRPTRDDKARAAAERRRARRALGRLRALAGRLEHQASLIRNGGFNPRAEAEAGTLADDAFAIRWALHRIAPEREPAGQVSPGQISRAPRHAGENR